MDFRRRLYGDDLMAGGVRMLGDAASSALNLKQTHADYIVGELDLVITFLEMALAAADKDSARRNMVLARQLLDSIEGSLGRRSLDLETKVEVQSRLDRVSLLIRQCANSQSERRGDQRCPDAALESSVETVAIQAVSAGQPTHAAPHQPQTENQDAPAAATRPRPSSQAAPRRVVRRQRSGADLASTWARCLRRGRTAWQEIDSSVCGAFVGLARWLKSPW